jgi:hypothetical protein
LTTIFFCLMAGLVVAVLAVMLWPRRKVAGAARARPVDVYSDLRGRFLGGSRAHFGLPPPTPEAAAWGVLMEMSYPEGTATLVSLIDGNASLYFSGGGGVIGGGNHAPVSAAARDFVRLASAKLPAMEAAATQPLPPAGLTSFYVLTDGGPRTLSAPEEELGEGQHAMSDLFYAGQEVITQLRVISERRTIH